MRQHERPQPGHGIAEVIDVNDLAQIVRLVRLAMRVILARPAMWRLAAGQHSCNRCEEITPVEAGR